MCYERFVEVLLPESNGGVVSRMLSTIVSLRGVSCHGYSVKSLGRHRGGSWGPEVFGVPLWSTPWVGGFGWCCPWVDWAGWWVCACRLWCSSFVRLFSIHLRGRTWGVAEEHVLRLLVTELQVAGGQDRVCTPRWTGCCFQGRICN